MVECRGRESLNKEATLETIVWWSAGGVSLNKEASWRPLFG